MKNVFALVAALATLNAFANGGTKVTGPNPLPTTAPAPGVLVRESFGAGPDYLRPAGGKGELRQVAPASSIGSFWVEWPGSKNTQWIAADGTWRFASATDDVNETLPSPLEAAGSNGTVISWWFDGVVVNSTALLPFAAPTTPWEVSVDVYPGVLAGAYVAVGFTSSGALADNLNSVGQLWLSMRQSLPLEGFTAQYELRANGSNGPLLASGTTSLLGYNPVSLRVDPLAQTVSATVNGTFLGSFPMSVAPRYLALEGQGYANNLVIRQVP